METNLRYVELLKWQFNVKVGRAAERRDYYLYNPSHELGTHIQRVVLHHVKGHSTHHQHMLLVVEVHTAVKCKGDKQVRQT